MGTIEFWIAPFFSALLAFAAALYWSRKKSKIDSEAQLRKEIADLQEQALLVAQAVRPISEAMQKMLIDKLTHYHTPTLDGLLKKLGPPVTLTPAEERKMLSALKRRTRGLNGRIDAFERAAAQALPHVMELVKLQKGVDETSTEIKVVEIPKNKEAPKEEEQ